MNAKTSGNRGLEDHEFSDLPDDVGLGHLPQQARARMRRLREWLSRIDWTKSEALALFCCYDPSSGEPDNPRGRHYLPGIEAFCNSEGQERDEAFYLNLDAGVDQLRQRAARYLPDGTHAPSAFLGIAIQNKLTVPWLKAAKNDQVCKKLLPLELPLTLPDGSESKPEASSIGPRNIHSLGGIAKRNKDMRRTAGMLRLRHLLAEGKSKGEIVLILEEEGDIPTSTAYGWIAQFERDENTDG